jgi:hypothetical protein
MSIATFILQAKSTRTPTFIPTSIDAHLCRGRAYPLPPAAQPLGRAAIRGRQAVPLQVVRVGLALPSAAPAQPLDRAPFRGRQAVPLQVVRVGLALPSVAPAQPLGGAPFRGRQAVPLQVVLNHRRPNHSTGRRSGDGKPSPYRPYHAGGGIMPSKPDFSSSGRKAAQMAFWHR